MTNGGSGGGSFNVPFTVEIEKAYQGETWVNRYFVNGSSLAGAVATAQAIVTAERSVHATMVTFTKASVRTNVIDDYVYQTIPLNVSGQYEIGAGFMAPLFVVARVDIQVTGSRASRKYLRGCLNDSDIDTFKVSDARQAAINTNYGVAITAIDEIVDPQGQIWQTALCNPMVGMRQLRRGSKKSPPHNSVE